MKNKFLCFLFILITSVVYAQSTTDFELDEEGLEVLIKAKVDSLRNLKGLKSLLNEEACYKAAKNHADYMSQNNVLRHNQYDVDSMYAPENRVVEFGGEKFLIGENILSIKSDDTSDEKKSNAIIKKWESSLSERSNLFSSEYDVTGVAVGLNEKESLIYVTQVFANVPDTFVYKLNKELFTKDTFSLDSLTNFVRKTLPPPHKKYAHKLSLPKDQSITRVNTKWLDENITLDIRDTGLFLCVKNLTYFRKLFKKKKDGLAFEIVNYETTYSCSPESRYLYPNRLNGGCIFNGRVTKPVYQKNLLSRIDTLIEQTKGQKDISCLGLFIDSIPDYFHANQSISLVYIRDRQIAKFIDFQGYCGSLMLPPLPKQELKFNFPYAEMNNEVKVKDVEFRVYFKRNSTDFEAEELDSILSLIDDDRVFVKEMRVNAFASIEGTSDINEKLYNKRGKALLGSFQERQTQNIELLVNTQENFDMFYEQIKDSKYSFLSACSKDSARSYVNQNVSSFDTLLDAQRYGEVILVLDIEDKKLERFDQAFAEYQKRYNRLNNVSSGQKRRDLKRLINLQGLLINATLSDSIQYTDYLNKLPVENSVDLTFQSVLAKYELKMIDDLDLYIVLEKFLKRDKSNKELRNNMDKIILKNQFSSNFNNLITTDLIDRFLEANEDLDDTSKKDLEICKHFILSNRFFYKNSGPTKYKGNKSLEIIKEHYDSLSIDKTIRKELGFYFIAFGQLEWAIEYLRPFERPESFDVEAYIALVKTITVRSVVNGDSQYQTTLMEASERLSSADFCGMFFGPCNIDFQIFEDATIRSVYCETCTQEKEN